MSGVKPNKCALPVDRLKLYACWRTSTDGVVHTRAIRDFFGNSNTCSELSEIQFRPKVEVC